LQLKEGLDRRSAIEMAARIRSSDPDDDGGDGHGLIPLLTDGAGAASRFSIGLVVVAGMSIGTLFTLFVLPSVYVTMATDHQAKAGLHQGDRRFRPWPTGVADQLVRRE
jgi:multidrug efflux pump